MHLAAFEGQRDRHVRTRRQRNIGNNGACITQDRRVIIFVVVVAIWLIIRVVAIRKFRRRRGERALLAGALPQGACWRSGITATDPGPVV